MSAKKLDDFGFEIVEEKAHSEFACSSSKRWLNCHAAISLSAAAPPLPDNFASQEGTDAHFCLEQFLRYRGITDKVREKLLRTYPIGMVNDTFNVFEEIIRIRKLYDNAPIYPEQRVDTSHFTEPGNFGTSDCVIAQEGGTLVVIDFKYGVQPVDAFENEQAICYALAVAKKHKYNFKKVRLIILQPRSRVASKTMTEWTCSMSELRSWEPKLKAAVVAARAKNPKPVKGDWCFFCPARVYNCPIHIGVRNKAALDRFDTLEDDFDLDAFLA